jgi:microcystin-dependent protein
VGTPYLSEIRIFSFNFSPKNWALCNGQFLPINQNQALFSLLGTMYGGNGVTTFALPNLQGRVPVHVGNGFTQGESGGEPAHTLTVSEMPAHNHFVNISIVPANTDNPAGNMWANGNQAAYTNVPAVSLNPLAVVPVGGSQPHENRSPFLVLNFCIALTGVFPSRN